MQVKWFKDCKPEDVKKRKELLLNSSDALDILSKICYNISIDESKSSKTDYDCPSWAFKQADLNGYVRAMKEIGDLCKLTKDH